MAKRNRDRQKKVVPSTVSSPLRTRSIIGRSAPWLARAAAIWLLVAAVEVALSALVPDTALRNTQLPLGARIGLVAYGLALLAAGVCVIGAPLMLVARFGPPRAHPAIRWAIAGIQFLVVGIAVFLYVTSWAAFWNIGVFLDRDAIAFWAPNPVQVFFWVYPPLAVGVIVVTLVSTLVFSRWVPRLVASRNPVLQRRLVAVAGGAIGVCVVAALIGALTYGEKTAATRQPKSLYATTRDDHTVPLVHALAAWSRHVAPDPALPATLASNGIKVIRRPVISPDQYLASIVPSKVKRWNVVMVQVESLRSDQLRAYGGTRDVMPTVDALARESRVFTNAYIQASHSNYADLVPLASHYPLRSSEIYLYPPDPTYPRVLIYDLLHALDYKTAIFSSQNERWGGMLNFHRLSSLDRFFDPETFDGPTYTPFGDVGFSAWVKKTKNAGSIDDKYTVTEAIKWLGTIGENPFFLHMNLQSSHVPYVVPKGFKRPFGPDKLDFTIMWEKFPIEKMDIVKDRYADSLFYEDTQIARLFEYLKEHGLWENTIIVIGGDNGEAFYEHGFSSHASALFNEVVKVPMIIKAPGVEPGTDDRPAMFLDIPPSLCQLLGIPSHPSFQGISLFEPHPNPDRSIYMIVQTPIAFETALVKSGFKLLLSEKDGRYFLLDLVHDPGELNDVAAARPDLVRQMSDRLQAWRREQLSYYQDASRHALEYPPFFED